MEVCDTDGDKSLSKCEIFDCIVMRENKNRDKNCDKLFCEAECFDDCKPMKCCAEIAEMTKETMIQYDTNKDGIVDLADTIKEKEFK